MTDTALLDQCIRLGPEAGAHEEFLNVAQAAEFPVEQVLAVTGTKQTTGDRDFAGTILLLIELAAANFKNDVSGGHFDRRGEGHRISFNQVNGKCRLIIRKRDGNGVYL